MKPLIAILSLACLGLAALLVIRHNKDREAEKDLVMVSGQVQSLSNEVVEARAKLDEEVKLASYLQSNLTVKVTDLGLASNSLAEASSSLAAAQSQLKTALEEAEKQKTRATDLEGQKDEMQNRLNELAGSIKALNTQIVETKRKLAAAEGDRDSLTKELAKLQSDKAELLRQFNDLAALRAQVALLKEEAAVNQRLAWIAQGVYQASGRKGAEALVSRTGPSALVANPALSVELQQNGSASSATPTNTPAKK
jgi:chromosome segregation ATPase